MQLVGSGADEKNILGKGAAFSLMVFVLLCVFAFGANGLNTDSIWTDELYAITNMGGFDGPYSPAEVINSVAENFPDHVPLFFLLGAVWANFAGWTQFALRLLPVFAGILMVAWTYRLTSDMFGRFSGLAAASFLGTSAYMILYIHDFRMYSLFLMLAAMHICLYWRVLAGKSQHGRVILVAFSLSTVALFYTHFFAIILFAGLGFFHLLFAPRARSWWQVLAGWAIGTLLFLPYLPVLIDGVQRASEKTNVISRAASAQELLYTLAFLLSNGSWLMGAILIGILVYVIARHRPTRLMQWLSLPIMLTTFIILANEAIGLIPLTRMRYFIVIWIPIVSIIGACLALIPRRYLVSGIVLLVWLVSGYQYYRSEAIMNHVSSMSYTRRFPPLPHYVYHLSGLVQPLDYLVGFSPSEQVNRVLSLGHSVADYYTHLYLGIDGAFIQRKGWGEWLESNIGRHMSNEPYMLLLYNPQDIPPTFDNVFGIITSNYLRCGQVLDSPELRVQRFVNPLAGCQREYQPIHYENGIRIVDRFGEYDAEKDLVRVVTGWEVASEQQLDEYNISIQLLDADWEKYWQNDWHLYNRIVKWHELEFQPTRELVPGLYRLVVILYDRYSGERIAGTDLTSGETSQYLPLLTFAVED